MKLVRFASLSLLVVLFLVGCGNDDGKLDPPEINYGVDMAEMGMPVVDPRFTVATLPADSDEWLLFDDIGEFLKYHQTRSDAFQVMWVPHHDTEEWMKAEDAWFVQSDEYCYSPMRWCVAAFDSEDSAHEAHMKFGGEMWSWDTVFDADWSQAPVPHDHDSDHPEDHDGHDDMEPNPADEEHHH